MKETDFLIEALGDVVDDEPDESLGDTTGVSSDDLGVISGDRFGDPGNSLKLKIEK